MNISKAARLSQNFSDRLSLVKQSAAFSKTNSERPRASGSSAYDASTVTGVSISMVDKGKINKQDFLEELEWLRDESAARCFLDSELWANEILAYMPENWENVRPRKPEVAAMSPVPSEYDAPAPVLAPGDVEMSEEKRDHTSKFARTLIKNKEFRRAAFFLEKTMKKNRYDHFLYYRALFLAHYQEHLENDSEGVERKTSFQDEKSPFATLHEQMTEQKLRESSDPWFELLMGLIEVQLGLKKDAEATMRNVIQKEPRMWPAWEALSLLIADIEDADKFVISSNFETLWFGDYFMVLVLRRFHQDAMAIQKCEQLVTRGLTGIPIIITKIAACANARHDHDQAIANFEDIRKNDPFRLTDLHLLSDSLYIRNDQEKLAELALEMFKVQKFRWETCCIVANYYAIRRDSEHAIKFFQRALRLNPSIAALWVLIGHEFMEMKNNAAACVSYRRAIEVDPVDHRGWYGLGQMYDIMKMPAYSLFYYQEAQKCKPNDSRLLVALGDVYAKLNRIEDAEKCFTGAYLSGDVEGNALWNLAKLHENNNENHKAAQVFEVFLVVYEQVTSAEEKVIYAVAFLANHFFKNDDFEKSEQYATRCMAYETLCHEGNRLFREIAKIHAREAEMATQLEHVRRLEAGEQMEVAQDVRGEESMSEGEDELSF
uniref:TPR_REGION domain-containing protein n=1 Tax=Caenorhabditis tropicalis TaxID=1561998 RepID=A0A1I7UK08_9PELO